MYWLDYANEIEEHSESPFQDPSNIELFFQFAQVNISDSPGAKDYLLF